MAVDNNNESHIVAAVVLLSKDEKTFLMNIMLKFKIRNPECQLTQCIITVQGAVPEKVASYYNANYHEIPNEWLQD